MSQLLFSLCRKLNKTEWRVLHQFAASPAHNSRDDVAQLLRYLDHYLPKNKDKYLEKTTVFAKLYPNKQEYDDAYLRYTLHLTHNLVRHFLAYQHWAQQETKVSLHLAQTLRQRQGTRNLEQALQEIQLSLEQQPLRNSDYYYDLYRFHSEQYEHSIAQQRMQSEHFQEMSDALNVFFMTQKLRQACAALSHRALTKTEYQVDFLQEVLVFLEQKPTWQAVKTIAIYYHVYHALIDIENNTHFEKIKLILNSSSALFPATELKDLFIHAINCCIKRLNAGNRAYLREVFELYRSGLECHVFLENGVLSRYTYNNIAMAGVGLQEFVWVERFLQDFKPFLEEKHRESSYHHTLAMYYFKKPDYAKARELLQQVEFDDVLHNLDARRMLLRIYYDTQEWDLLDAHLDTFKTYLYRQKNVGYHQENYLNLIRFTRKLVAFDYDAKALEVEINDTSALVEKAWLLEKI